VKATTSDQFFDFLGVLLNGSKAAGKKMTLNMKFPDMKENYVLTLENSALSHTPNKQAENADCTITIPRITLTKLIMGELTPDKAMSSGELKIQGKIETLLQLTSLLDKPESWFNIVTP
jgi:alkyl sulfatase BDS1-like metallo-beta-lactamase superfamily hydrolase